MMSSLFAGVSGLKNHQTQLDVIGDNIANVNTVGYKASRVTFKESLCQATQLGQRPTSTQGGINPMYIGNGMSVGSIDKVFNQGNLEKTDNDLDLAIDGDAFFVLSNGAQNYFTRAGNFQVDSVGNLVAGNTGLRVQGRMADAVGNVISETDIEDIVFPFAQKSPAKATTEVSFSGNLDSESDKVSQVLSASIASSAYVISDDWANLDAAVLDADGNLVLDATNNSLQIILDNDAGGNIDKTITLSEGTYSSFSDLAAEINQAIENDRELSSEVEAVVEDGQLKINTVDSGGADTYLQLGDSFTAIATSTGQLLSTDPQYGTRLGDAAAAPAVDSTDLSELSFLSEVISVGDEINISGANNDGSTITASFVYGPTDPADPDFDAANSGTTVEELVEFLNAQFTDATVSLENSGNLRVTDAISGESNTYLNITMKDTTTSTIHSFPTFSILEAGKEATIHSTSINVYDSKGKAHTVEIQFTNISSDSDPDLWRWEAGIDDGEITPTAGSRGYIKFNPDGSLATFEIEDGEPLTFEPEEGAETMRIELDPGTPGYFNGITQFGNPTTTVASNQDGYGMGDLYDFSFDETGTITGHFTNGVSQVIAQVAVANFNNAAGLEQSGQNLYTAGGNSGMAIMGFAGSTIQAEIAPGHLEMSTVDLTTEFTNMIIAQRGYQANSKIITTSDTLLNEIIQLKR